MEQFHVKATHLIVCTQIRRRNYKTKKTLKNKLMKEHRVTQSLIICESESNRAEAMQCWYKYPYLHPCLNFIFILTCQNAHWATGCTNPYLNNSDGSNSNSNWLSLSFSQMGHFSDFQRNVLVLWPSSWVIWFTLTFGLSSIRQLLNWLLSTKCQTDKVSN